VSVTRDFKDRSESTHNALALIFELFGLSMWGTRRLIALLFFEVLLPAGENKNRLTAATKKTQGVIT